MNREIEKDINYVKQIINEEKTTTGIKFSYTLSTKTLERLINYIETKEQENQQLKQVNSYSKRNLYKINKDRLEANLKLVEENKKLKEQLELYDNGVIYDSRVDKLESVLDKIREYIKEHKEYLEKAKEMYINCDDELLKSTCIQLINNELVKNDNLLQTLDKVGVIMSAKEMFEELGYQIRKDETERKYNILCYTKNCSYQTINFWLNEEDKFITMGNIKDNFEQTFKAINKQIEELGWNE